MRSCCWKGAFPRVETPVTPDEVDEADALDAGDVVEGLGVVGVDRVECVGLSGGLLGDPY